MTKPGTTEVKPPALQSLEGTLERVTYQNEENGYTVARLIPRGKTYEVTVVGAMAGVNVGESVKLLGVWTNHSQYGRQFEVRSYTVQYPSTIEGIRKYLGSGLIRGIGPVNASRIVDTFGKDTLDVIENQPHRLREVPGIGEKRSEQIASAWEDQKLIKEIMIFLQSQGVSTSLAVKIFKAYGATSVQVVTNDPYRLAKDIYGIGFKTADKIARQMGLPVDAPERIRAGLTYALNQLSEEGHCYAEQIQLFNLAASLLELSPEVCRPQLDFMLRSEELIAEDDAIYLPPFYHAERSVATKLRRIQGSDRDRLGAFRSYQWDQAFQWLDSQSVIHLTDQQKQAVKMALTEKVSVLTGGPGTGKSTITASIISLLKTRNGTVLLAAPTGRAAKRLSEATGMPAKTIHRLLEFSPSVHKPFLRDQQNPLDCDLIIIDETSMVDILLMNHLLSAIENGSHLLLVGDMDQLPSVGPGNVLRDIIGCERIPVVRLETIFRQAEDSYIIVNAHRINHGEMPIFTKQSNDFYLFVEENPQKAADWVIDLVSNRIPAKFGFRPEEDIQVLCPMHRGSAGVAELNERLQSTLNPPATGKGEIKHGARVIRQSDRVMQIRNDYDRLVFNGDLGRVSGIDLEDHSVIVNFDGRDVVYEFSQLDELVHAYAASIHKAQGSEFPVVVIPILTQHYRMLQRNLLYTGVTRARKIVVLVGSKRAIYIAVKNNQISARNTRLAARIRDEKFTTPGETGFWYRG
jgi:exodeoxyribonuclease V alpha subunit